MALSNELIQAVNRYGPSVSGVAKRYGISGEALLAKLIQGESGGRRDQTSSAGAKGYTQFMPGTRQEVLSRYGIDPWGGPDEAVHAAALHLRGKLGHATGLRGYNPGSPTYTDYILNQKVGDVHRGGGSRPSGGSSGGFTPVTLTAQVPTPENSFDPGQGSDLSALAGLLQQPPAPPPVQAPQAPNSSQRYLSSAGTSPLVTPPAPQQDNLGALLAAIQSPGEGLPEVSRGSESVSVSGSVPSAQAASTGGQAGRLPSGTANFEGTKVAGWIAPALRYARQHGWKGQVNSGYRSYAEQKRIYESGVRPAAKPGRSNHEGSEFPRGAIDVSDASSLARILRRSPYANRLIWAGAKDPVHFSHPHGGSY